MLHLLILPQLFFSRILISIKLGQFYFHASSVNFFCKKAPSQMFAQVLKTPDFAVLHLSRHLPAQS